MLQQLVHRLSHLRANKFHKENHRPKKRKIAHKIVHRIALANNPVPRVIRKAEIKVDRAIIVETFGTGLIFAARALWP